MVFGNWFATRKVRHGATAGVVVLATGGLFLLHANAATQGNVGTGYDVPSPVAVGNVFATPPLPVAGPDTVTFSGPHVRGTMAVSGAHALAGDGQPLYADITLTPDASAGEHAPLALVIVLDTSGSMEGEKLREAKSAAKELIRNMRDDDEVAFVHYASEAEVVQPLARVGAVRELLASRIEGLSASGGTAIPLGLAAGVNALQSGLLRSERGTDGRVKRVVLVSDGLDSSRPRSEFLAQDSAEKGITVSSMGIGVDFDEAYMGGVARSGHGNFGFVNDGPTLTAFLQRELVETATTVAQSTTVHLHMPEGVRFVKATGASADVHGRDVDLKVGALYADTAKRVLVQMTTDLAAGKTADFSGSLTWKTVGGGGAEATNPQLEVLASADANDVARNRNETVFARVTSVEASERQVEAAQAYADGNQQRANDLIQTNVRMLKKAAMAAPAPAASALSAQSLSYESTMASFGSSAPSSTSGKIAAKHAAASNMANSNKSAF